MLKQSPDHVETSAEFERLIYHEWRKIRQEERNCISFWFPSSSLVIRSGKLQFPIGVIREAGASWHCSQTAEFWEPEWIG